MPTSMCKVFAIAAVALALALPSEAVSFRLYKGAAECVTTRVPIGEWPASQETVHAVIQGDFGVTNVHKSAKVDWSLVSPTGELLGAGQGVTVDTFTVQADTANGKGDFTLCFAVSGGSGASAVIDLSYFAISLPNIPGAIYGTTGEPEPARRGAADTPDNLAPADKMTSLEGQVLRLRGVISDIRLEQRRLAQRDHRHKETIASTSKRAVWTTVAECAVAVGGSLIQVVAIRRLFTTRELASKSGRPV